jgi:hypothetical protein
MRVDHITPDRLARYDGELGLSRRIVVDTSGPVDTPAVVAAVREALEAGRSRQAAGLALRL